jgi:hypothetical protein
VALTGLPFTVSETAGMATSSLERSRKTGEPVLAGMGDGRKKAINLIG